jgi:hypothetical protein
VEPPEPRLSWYEPLPEGEALEHAVGFVLANPQLFLVSSSDPRRLVPILDAAGARTGGRAPTTASLQADVERQAMRPLFDGAELERI